MPQNLELSPYEVELVQRHREEQARLDAAQEFRRVAIKKAAAFSEWSDATGEGLTFSTFLNNFGYQGKDAKQMYDAVDRILHAALPI